MSECAKVRQPPAQSIAPFSVPLPRPSEADRAQGALWDAQLLATRIPSYGRDFIVRFVAGVARKNEGVAIEARSTTVNGLPGLVLLVEGSVLQTLAFEIHDGLLSAIFTVRNPEKLARVVMQ